MRQRTFVVGLGGLALLFWLGLLALMNYQYPDSLNQVLFLALWLGAVALTAAPVAYLVGARVGALRSRPRLLRNRSLRQGLIVGLLATTLMALRFLRLLTPVTAVPLVLVAIMAEVLANLRRR